MRFIPSAAASAWKSVGCASGAQTAIQYANLAGDNIFTILQLAGTLICRHVKVGNSAGVFAKVDFDGTLLNYRFHYTPAGLLNSETISAAKACHIFRSSNKNSLRTYL